MHERKCHHRPDTDPVQIQSPQGTWVQSSFDWQEIKKDGKDLELIPKWRYLAEKGEASPFVNWPCSARHAGC